MALLSGDSVAWGLLTALCLLGHEVWNSVRCKVASLLRSQVPIPFKYDGATLYRTPLILELAPAAWSLQGLG